MEGPVLRRNAAVYTGSVDTAPVLKYNLNGYFSAAIHDSVSDQIRPVVGSRRRQGLSLSSPKFVYVLSVVDSFVLPLKMSNKKPRSPQEVAGLEMVLKVQAITYPRTSFVRSLSSVLGPYLTIKPDEIALVPCNRMAAKLRQCFVVKDMVFMALESVFFI